MLPAGIQWREWRVCLPAGMQWREWRVQVPNIDSWNVSLDISQSDS